MTKEKYLTISEAAKYTGLSRRTIQRYVATGKLPSTKNDSGVRQISILALQTYTKVEHSNQRSGEQLVQQILLEMLELIPLNDIAALSKKQRLREMINQLGNLG